jgi:homoserine kinase type II
MAGKDKISDREARTVLGFWRLKPVFMRPGGGTANASVIIVGSRGQFFLRRRNIRYSAPDQLTFDHSVLHELAKAGLPVPKIIRTPQGSRWVEHDGRIYELFDLIEGQDADPESLEEIAEAARVLAKLHLATKDLEPSGKKAWPRYFDPKAQLKGLKEAKKLLKSGMAGDFGNIEPQEVAETIDFLIDQAKFADEKLPDKLYWSFPQTIIHGDWHPANLKFKDHKIVGIFDFDWASRQPRVVDVTDGLLFFGSRRKGKIEGADIWSLTQPFELDWDRMALFMREYRAQINLTREEMSALPDLMIARFLYMRVDAMVRKIEPKNQLRFLVTGVKGPFEWIGENEERLRQGEWD